MAHSTHGAANTRGAAGARGAPGMDKGSRTLTVVALDPVPIFAEGLHTVVSHTPGLRWAGHAASHHAAIQACEQLRPDIALIDSGFDPQCHLVRLLNESHPALLIVVLVAQAQRTSGYLTTVLAAGAHGTVPRTAEPRRLTDSIRRTYLERRYTDPSLAALLPTARQGGDSADGPGFGARRPPMPLSRREYQVLQLVAEGMENSAVAETLFLSVETVRTHVKSILRKLSARDRTHAVTKAFRSGLLVLTPDSPEQTPGPQLPGPQPR